MTSDRLKWASPFYAFLVLIVSGQFAVTPVTLAQGGGCPPEQWMNEIPVNPISSVAVSRYGTAYICGHERGTAGDDLFVAAFNPSGHQLRRFTFDVGATEIPRNICVDSYGNSYVCGETSKSGQKDGFIVKFNWCGHPQWIQRLSTSGVTNAEDVAVDRYGNVYVTGVTGGKLHGENHLGRQDIFIVKYDYCGRRCWTRLLGGSDVDYGKSIEVDGYGNVFVAGFVRNRAFVTAYDANGNEKWRDEVADPGSRGFGIDVDCAGNVYVCGNVGGGKNQDAFVSKYSRDGTQLWFSQLGDPNEEDSAHDVAVDPAGNPYIVGTTYGNLGGSNTGARKAFFAYFSHDGLQHWVCQTGKGGSAMGVALWGSGLYVCGESPGSGYIAKYQLSSSFGSTKDCSIRCKCTKRRCCCKRMRWRCRQRCR